MKIDFTMNFQKGPDRQKHCLYLIPTGQRPQNIQFVFNIAKDMVPQE